MDKFQILENKGRNYFLGFLKQCRKVRNWFPTLDKYNSVDGFIDIDEGRIVVEIKVRDPKYLNYPSHLMELEKDMNLTKAKIDYNCLTGWYVNFFGCDTLYIYDLNRINSTNCKLITRYVNATTAEDNGKMLKHFFEIPVSFALKYKLENNKWIRI